jgi:hypothetical protein
MADRTKGLILWTLAMVMIAVAVSWLVYVARHALLGVPYFYVLALIAAIGEMVPVIGPILSAAPAILAGLSVSPKTALFVAVFWIAQQQIENHLLVPKVNARSASARSSSSSRFSSAGRCSASSARSWPSRRPRFSRSSFRKSWTSATAPVREAANQSAGTLV